MTSARLFISVDIPKNIAEEIKKIQEQLPEFKGKKTETENLHLTLKFLGYVEEKKLNEIKKNLKKIKSKKFDTVISEIGVFPPYQVRIVWLKMGGVENLQREIDDSLKDLFEEERRFMGHLTIARVKSVEDRKAFLEELKKIKIPPDFGFEVKNFKLKKSTLSSKGPVYEAIEEYGLA